MVIEPPRHWVPFFRVLTKEDHEAMYCKFSSQCRDGTPIGASLPERPLARFGSGYCLEMICADFLTGSPTEQNQLEVLVLSLERLYQKLSDDRRNQLLNRFTGRPMERLCQKRPRLILKQQEYYELKTVVLDRDGWKCQYCGSSENLQVYHLLHRSRLGSDELENLMTLCANCHRRQHSFREDHQDIF
jgi:HNH endonuclease